MAYYPKNKIINNLQTSGEEYQLVKDYNANNKNYYVGFYYKLSNGEFHTGKYPGDGANDRLIYNPLYTIIDELTTAPQVTPALITKSTPPLYPTDQDYKNGFFIRYFYKKRNEYLFKELTQDEYNNLNQPNNRDFYYYKPFSIKWMLTGDKQKVTDFNFYSIAETEKQEKVYGLNEFLNSNYTQYYK